MIAFTKSLVHSQYCIKSPFSLGINATFDTVRSERDRKGRSAQEFVLNEKNNLFQSKRVLSMLEAK